MTDDEPPPAEWTPAAPPDLNLAGLDADALRAEQARVTALACALAAEQAECAAVNAPPTRRIAAQNRERCCRYRLDAVRDALAELSRRANDAREAQAAEARRARLDRAAADQARQREAVAARADAQLQRLLYLERFHDLARTTLPPGDYASLCEATRRRVAQAVPE